ncbi:MAG: DUF4837 family protein [Bacteroidales bacterium]|nr:DUF4837 family protein [Bacteroidales bacterium]
MKRIILFLAAAMALAGCNSGKPLLPSVSGKAGEIVVVIDKENWEGALGSDIRDLLACDCPYLSQKEALYTLINIAPGGFTDIFKVHRNILVVNPNPQTDSSQVLYSSDVWSTPQCVIQVCGKDAAECQQLIQEKGSTIRSGFEQAERNRVIANSIRYEEEYIADAVRPVFGGSAHFPTGYKLRKISDDFAWIAYDKETLQDILIYRYPAIEAEPFTRQSMLEHRNAILKENVPGMRDNSWMTTSEGFPVTVEYTKYQGREFAEMRGYWEVENDYMGGPFVSHSFFSRDGRDIIVLDAFVYAPKYDKRQYLRQVESILYSWEWNEELPEK